MIYLATPYSHDDPEVMEERFALVTATAAQLMLAGYVVYSPITHGHAVQVALPEHLRTDHVFWLKQSMPFLCMATDLYVLKLDGWQDSIGVQWEIATAVALGKNIEYVEIETIKDNK
jgi:hypothetical protein